MALMATQLADELSMLNSPSAGVEGLGSVRPRRTATRANQALTDLMAAFAGDPATQAALGKSARAPNATAMMTDKARVA
jgi:hypothetical protein